MAAKPTFNWPSGSVKEKVDPKEALRAVHWNHSYRDSGSRNTETRDKFHAHKIEIVPSFAETNGKDLKASHIDFAAGADKSGKEWIAVMRDDMSKAEAEKYGCKKPEGMEYLGAMLRKSMLSLDQGIPQLPEEVVSFQKSSYQTPAKMEQAASFAESLGKELRESRIDISNGQPKGCGHWAPVMTEEMSRHAAEKFECKREKGFEALAKELRKSSVPLSGAI